MLQDLICTFRTSPLVQNNSVSPARRHSVASTLPRSFSQEAVGVACPSPPSQGCGRPGPSRLPNPPPDRLSVDDDVDSNVVSGASAVVSGRSRRPSHALDRPPSGAGVQQLSDKERIFLNMGSSSRSPSKPPTPQVVAGDVVDLTMDSDHEVRARTNCKGLVSLDDRVHDFPMTPR